MKLWLSIAVVAALIFGGSSPSFAACSGPTGAEGDMIYNTTHHMMQFCDDTDWIAMAGTSSGSGCAAPTDCGTMGDTCSDGSIFAGFVLSDEGSCRTLFVTDADQGTATAWGPTGVVTGATSHNEGQINQSWVEANATLSDYPAFEMCSNLNRHSATDWYLPSRIEILNVNRAVALSINYYWSSTQFSGTGSNDRGYGVAPPGGESPFLTKSANQYVRCVRSEASSGGGGGTTSVACEGPSDCDVIGEVCTDGTVFAGCNTALGTQLFVTRCDAGETWNGSICTGTISTFDYADAPSTNPSFNSIDSIFDGATNTAALIAADADLGTGGVQQHPAAQYCADLNVNGWGDSNSANGALHADWYLPSILEMQTVVAHKDAIGNISAVQFWTSTETEQYSAFAIPHSTDDPAYWGGRRPKIIDSMVRCMRSLTP